MIRIPRATFLLIAALAMVGCVPVGSEIGAFDADGSPTGEAPRQGDLANCEVKSNQNEPCLIDDTGSKATVSSDEEVKALAVPYPAQCKTIAIPKYDPDKDADAAFERGTASSNTCASYLEELDAIYPDRSKMPGSVGTRYQKAYDTGWANLAAMAQYLKEQNDWIGENLVIRDDPEEASSATSSNSGGSGSGTCANPFGGSSASGGQFICSDQGEIQACQCSGGSCDLVPTGSFLCSRAGAVID